MNDPRFTDREGYDTPEYKAWRFAIFVRDDFRCVRCMSKDHIEAHHIKKWASYPHLRYAVSNGVALCKMCHDLITGHEEQYEDELTRYVALKKIQGAKKSSYTPRDKKKKGKWRPINPHLRY